jgi:predicted nuclease of predicted toxin-antitoxin system
VKFKLDENLDPSLKRLFVDAGHDCLSVHDQGMAGWPDDQLLRALQAEDRCIISADLDFADPFKFPPGRVAGIILLRAPQSTFAMFEILAREAIQKVNSDSPKGELWIAEPGRIRVHKGT